MFGVQTVVVSLCNISIGAGVVVAISFQKVDGAPNSEAGSESHYECLKYADRAVEKCHFG